MKGKKGHQQAKEAKEAIRTLEIKDWRFKKGESVITQSNLIDG